MYATAVSAHNIYIAAAVLICFANVLDEHYCRSGRTYCTINSVGCKNYEMSQISTLSGVAERGPQNARGRRIDLRFRELFNGTATVWIEYRSIFLPSVKQVRRFQPRHILHKKPLEYVGKYLTFLPTVL